MTTTRTQAFACRFIAELAQACSPTEADFFGKGFTQAEKDEAIQAIEAYRQRMLAEASMLERTENTVQIAS